MAKKKSETSSTEETTPATGKSMTKAEAARAAMRDGYTSPKIAVDYIRTTYGVEMSPTHFSAIKSLLNKTSGSSPVKRGPGRPRSTPAIPPTGEADLLQAMEAMKPLIASLGVEKVKRLADLLA